MADDTHARNLEVLFPMLSWFSLTFIRLDIADFAQKSYLR